MPWIKDSNNEPKYVPSMYVKEELPTWSEVYNEFYKNKLFLYDPKMDSGGLDTYWKIPKNRYLIAIVCNQFNKMLYEDHVYDFFVQYLNEILPKDFIHVKSVQFICEPAIQHADDSEYLTMMNVGIKAAPPPYNIVHPKGHKNPFIPKDSIRIDWNTHYPDEKMYFTPAIYGEHLEGKSITNIVYLPSIESDPEVFHQIIDWMMIPYKGYFEGEGIGWKDQDGHLITSIPFEKTGYDPAL